MKKILVIDDDSDILEAVQLILSSEGYESEVISKGDEVSQKVATYHPALIILDVLLSGKDGREICKNLKADPVTNHIPVIMMSAHPSAKNTIKDFGADSFIEKPFSILELLTTIQGFVGEA